MQPNEQLVQQYAYQIWESEGRPDGQAARHWEMACMLAEGQTGPADPFEPLTGGPAVEAAFSNTPKSIDPTPPTAKRKKSAPSADKKNLTGPAEQEVTMESADPMITPPPSRVRVSAVMDDPAAAPKKRISSKDKTQKH
jgi:hypothetical protein